MLVRTDDTLATLQERRRALADEVVAIAAAPVRHLPAEFLHAVEGLFPAMVGPLRRSAVR